MEHKRGETVRVYDSEDKIVDAIYDGLDTNIKGFKVHRVHIFKKGEKVVTMVKAARSARSRPMVKTLKKEGWRTWYLPESRFVVR